MNKNNVKEKSFYCIPCRRVTNYEEYKSLQKEIKSKLMVDEDIDKELYNKMKYDLMVEINETSSEKESSLSIHLPCIIITPSVVLSVLAGIMVIDNNFGLVDGIIVALLIIVYIALLVRRSRYIVENKNCHLQFYNTIHMILEEISEKSEE